MTWSVEALYNYCLSQYGDFKFTVHGSLLILVAAFIIPSIPFFLFQFFPAMDRFKLQKRKNSVQEQVWCAFIILLSHTFIYVPAAIAGYYYIFQPGHVPYDYQSIPHWSQFIWKPLLALVMEDTWHYFNHRLLHHPRLYGYIHKIHHTYTTPFSISAEYAHPIETIWLGIGFFIPLYCFTNHITIGWAWLVLRLIETTDVHSGYYFPYLNPLYLLPGYGGSPFHDFHHKNFTGNYGSSFIWWDWLFGTDKEYKAYLLALKKQEQNKSISKDVKNQNSLAKGKKNQAKPSKVPTRKRV